MCNCAKEKEKLFSEATGKECYLNTDILTGQLYLQMFHDEVGRTGKSKQITQYLGLNKCPWCQEEYIKKEAVPNE